MNHDKLQMPPRTDECIRVLAAYSSEAAVQKTLDAAHDGWLGRVREIEGVPVEELPEIHGRLIAHGLLKVQLAGRKEGVRYQLSGLGKEQLARGADTNASESSSGDETSETPFRNVGQTFLSA